MKLCKVHKCVFIFWVRGSNCECCKLIVSSSSRRSSSELAADNVSSLISLSKLCVAHCLWRGCCAHHFLAFLWGLVIWQMTTNVCSAFACFGCATLLRGFWSLPISWLKQFSHFSSSACIVRTVSPDSVVLSAHCAIRKTQKHGTGPTVTGA